MGKLIKKDNEENIYLMFNKPAGYLTARSDDKDKTIFDILPDELKNNYTIFPVGRLDKDTEGLILLTNDGLFNHKVIHADSNVTKTYEFWALGNLDKKYIKELKNGVCIDDKFSDGKKITKSAKLKVINKSKFIKVKNEIEKLPLRIFRKQKDDQDIFYGSITLSEGRKHEVKRLLKYSECFIIYLKRVSIGKLKLDKNLKLGEYRKLTDKEIKYFMK